MSNQLWNHTFKRILCFVLLASFVLTPAVRAEEVNGGQSVVDAAPETGETTQPTIATLQTPPNADASGTENLPLFPSDVVNKEVRNSNDFYFEINPARRVLEGSYVELFISHSGMLNPKHSVLTVLLDDVPLDSQYLDETNKERTSYLVDLSKHLNKPGFHKLSLVSNLESRGNICDDLRNPGNWLILHKDSLVHLNIAKSNSTPDLKWYPNPFLEKGSLTPLGTIFVVPDTMQATQLQALGKLSRFFAKQVPDSRLNYAVYKESEVTEELLANRHSIWIGHKDGWKDKGLRAATETRKQVTDPAKGYIALAPSPWNASKSLLMLEADEKTIERGADLLSEPSLYGQLQGTGAIIPDTIKIPAPSAKPQDATNHKVTFEQLGYQDMVMENVAVGHTRIQYTFPSEWDVNGKMKLKLLYRHSKALNYAESVMTVSVNNTPAASKFLNAESSDTGILEITIPKDAVVGKPSMIIDISFQLWTTKDRDTCAEASPHLGEWAIVDKASYLTVPFQDRNNYQLSNLPAPFIKGGKWDTTTFVLPENPTSKELSLFTFIRSNMGKIIDSDEGVSVALASANMKATLEKNNLIMIGGVETVPAAFWESGSLPYRMEGKTIVPTMPNMQLLPQAQNQSAMLSLSVSPWNKNKSLLLYTSTERDEISRWNDILHTPEQDGKLKGSLALVDSIDRIHTFEQPQNAPKKPGFFSNLGDKLSMDGHSLIFRFAISLLFVAVIAILGIALWKMRKRRNKTRRGRGGRRS
ncbi:cellulose biosynthesis cyclic di-GMP-binding regulatory protein BcsB [Paenibacillus sp. N1-5-1-14]|uniref:cellulose biosynthesis cyclic di-GMP-binding regulatory protein BcsB n=1 Tax=Paenibacillus radicibacter TaxID=2972488 RepID=UPI0021590890|nr:cellulose biosynthesis cyclic di-GMP-binding regulatory protein BcsB [Paenibacillus radicibacter]MCR8643118.1 cellulose biosynthesis cyclic di-GMP-binding regulatory protein BcsB [Paenibacillus radicibacter]